MEHLINYYEIDIFRCIYLEDSYVLDITLNPEALRFSMEFVLTEAHPLYTHPQINHQYCYKKGEIIFINPELVQWQKSEFNYISIDANGETDFGNIDTFYKQQETYYLSGEWGNISLKCQKININYL